MTKTDNYTPNPDCEDYKTVIQDVSPKYNRVRLVGIATGQVITESIICKEYSFTFEKL